MAAMLATVFLASLVGSLHCVGMCGGLVAFYSGADASRGARRWASHVVYNFGRLFTYALLGAIAGAIGSVVDLAGAKAGYGRVAGYVAGGLMIAWGLFTLAQALGVKLPKIPAPRALTRAVSTIYAKLKGKPPVVRAGALGLFSALLPCGWLYAFAFVAGGTGQAWRGALVMAAFWAGTVPWLAALGVSVQFVAGPIRKHVPVLMALMLMVIGVMAAFDRTHVSFDRALSVGSMRASAIQAGEAADEDTPSCCKGK